MALLLHDIPPHMSKEQTAVSHSSAESDITSNDAGLRMDGSPALQCWECVLETLSCKTTKVNLERHKSDGVVPSHSHSDPSLLIQRQCGSCPQWTKAKPEARHMNAQSRFGLVV